MSILFQGICVADNPDFETVEGGALYLSRSGFETHRAEFDIANDCEHVAKIMNEAEPAVRWHCSTSVPDVVMNCEISGFEIEAQSEVLAMIPETLSFRLVLNRGLALGSSKLDLPLDFEYTESDEGYLFTNDYPYASGNAFTKAIYLLVVSKDNGDAGVKDIGGAPNGNGECRPVEN